MFAGAKENRLWRKTGGIKEISRVFQVSCMCARNIHVTNVYMRKRGKRYLKKWRAVFANKRYRTGMNTAR